MSNNTVTIDLTGDNAVNIGSKYVQKYRMFDVSRDLENGYVGLCQVRLLASGEVILSPTVTVLSSDIFQLSLAPDNYLDVTAGNYLYDIRFSKNDDVFFPVAGKFQLIQRITRLV